MYSLESFFSAQVINVLRELGILVKIPEDVPHSPPGELIGRVVGVLSAELYGLAWGRNPGRSANGMDQLLDVFVSVSKWSPRSPIDLVFLPGWIAGTS